MNRNARRAWRSELAGADRRRSVEHAGTGSAGCRGPVRWSVIDWRWRSLRQRAQARAPTATSRMPTTASVAAGQSDGDRPGIGRSCAYDQDRERGDRGDLRAARSRSAVCRTSGLAWPRGDPHRQRHQQDRGRPGDPVDDAADVSRADAGAEQVERVADGVQRHAGRQQKPGRLAPRRASRSLPTTSASSSRSPTG